MKKWHSWVLNIAAKTNPPKEWVAILQSLDRLGLDDSYIDKIELAAFAIRGERTARWNLDSNHPEYATITNALGAAKKLTWLLLKSEGGPGISAELIDYLKCSQSPSCILLEGHNARCKQTRVISKTFCPICLNIIKLDEFDLDGRKDAYSIQMGHAIPLCRTSQGHTAKNVFWSHRICNYIQGKQTVEEAIETLRKIVEKHRIANRR